jgi:hypothetical protein
MSQRLQYSVEQGAALVAIPLRFIATSELHRCRSIISNANPQNILFTMVVDL